MQDVDTAIQYINARPTPLSLYVCSSNRKVFLKGELFVAHDKLTSSHPGDN